MYFVLQYKSFSVREARSLQRPEMQKQTNFDEGIQFSNPPESIDFTMRPEANLR
ncbi:hypothetical protein [Leptospira alstonii]|uniref:hypothetical protein n=1 Tax=Leptospira alstonii TaxID=28452 RepID=UPI000A9B82ED|nr:hypothetical protein [Leptospira alstonii]